MKKAFLEDCLAKGMSLEQIGKRIDKHPSTIGYWLKQHGLTARGAAKFSRRGPIDREALKTCAARGETLAQMAKRFDRSVSTVQYWLTRYEIKAVERRGPWRRCPNGSKVAVFDCKRHGTTEFIREGRGYYRCKRCRSEAVARRRRKVKQKLVAEAGGECVLCGYSRCLGALQFHHVEPDSKEFHLAHRGHSRSIAKSRAEMKKCVLLCANCHAEVETGFATLPAVIRLQDSEDATSVA